MALKKPVQAALDRLNCLADLRHFDPTSEKMRFTVAANDMQRDLIFPQLFRELQNEGISVEFELIPSGHPTLAMMRTAHCDMALTPVPPEGTDIFQKSLFSGKMMCFYDKNMRDPPGSLEEFNNADHLRTQFAKGHTSLDVLQGIDKSKVRVPAISVSNFNAIPRFVKGTSLMATEVDLMYIETLKDLDMAPLPFESDAITIYMIWHERSANDPAHAWLRQRIQKFADELRDKIDALHEEQI